MPIPTDTFWNIKKLNWVFAISCIALVGVTVWTILQDYGGDWRTRQQQARVWEAALTRDKIERDLTPDKQKQLDGLQSQIDQAKQNMDARGQDYKKLQASIKEMESRRDTLSFGFKVDKADIGVDQAHLQDAITAGDDKEAEHLRQTLANREKKLAADNESLHAIEADISKARKDLSAQGAALEELKKTKVKLEADADLARKKLAALQPQSALAKLSAQIRAAPLAGFMNPADKPQQVVLPDVMTDMNFDRMRIPTVDRCTTCHTNIAKKEFAEDKVLAYLEEQSATTRQLKLPAKFSGVPTDPTATNEKPGPVAMTDFWHGWARKVSPDALRKASAKLKSVTNTVGKTAKVTFNGAPLLSFAFDPNLDDAKARASAATQPAASTQPYLVDPDAQSAILVTLLEGWLRYDPSKPSEAVVTTSPDGKVSVEISQADEKSAKPIRNAVMRYAPELAAGLKLSQSKEAWKLLNDRYRFAMIAVVNPERKKQGLALLDSSPVNLAHPQLDLYCDPDSKHPVESGEGKIGMGCTSCHDGSGQETEFVLAAHTPREIWVDQKSGEPVLEAQLGSAAEEKKPFEMASMLSAVFPEGTLIPAALASLAIECPPKEATIQAEKAEKDLPTVLAYIDPATGKAGRAVKQFTYWREKYEPSAPRPFELVYEEWDWPMRTPEYIQVNCARCHADVYDIKEAAPTLFEGRYLFANLGCVNCHQMDSIPAEQNRKVGTDLRHVTSKLSKEYINTWIWAPKSFRPTTKMPHFFMLENSSSDEELRRTRQEARCITEYLAHTAEPLPPKNVAPAALKGSPEAGKIVFNTIGCQGCHANLNDPQAEKRGGKNITLGEKWIVTDLVKSGRLKAEMTEQSGGKEPAAGAVSAAAQKMYDGMTYNERQLYVLENLEQIPGTTEKPLYPDGSPKPLFLHHGPELSGVGTKLTAGRTVDEARAWLYDWVKDPRHYSDYTVMPRLRLNDQQALDLSEFLLSMKRTNDKPDDPWSAGLTPVDRDKQIELTALQLNNKYSFNTSFQKADEDKELTALATDAMTTPICPTDKAKELVSSMNNDEKRMVFLGKKLIAHYGCMSCHAINGLETISSPCANLSDWGQKQVSKLDYGYLSEHQHMVRELPPTAEVPMVNGLSAEASKLAHDALQNGTAKPVTCAWPVIEMRRQDWITQKLKNTRIFDRGRNLLEPSKDSVGRPYDKLRMPTFYLNDEQVHAIVTFVLTARDPLVSDRLRQKAMNEQQRQIARGRELVTRYNCVSCHMIDGNVPQVQQYFKPDDITVLAPPSLRGEGNKIQHEWLFNFFKDVFQMRPRIFNGIHMPSFPATDDEWTAIIAYFNAESKKESKDLRVLLDPVQKYIAEARKASPTTRPLAPNDVWPGDDWYTRPGFAMPAEKLKNWALANNFVNELQFDPTKNKADELGRNYRTALEKARFVIELFDAPYPFVDSGSGEIATMPKDQAEARFKLGEQFFYDLQCLKCHVLGDPDKPGANKTPTAPNLTLARDRLQRRWVRHWAQDPDIIQKGTAMPPFFTGLPIYATVTPDGKAPLGQSQPRAQTMSQADIDEREKKYGKSVQEQTGLLLDFLYEAGKRGYTGMQPESAAPTPAPTTKPATKPSAKSGSGT